MHLLNYFVFLAPWAHSFGFWSWMKGSRRKPCSLSTWLRSTKSASLCSFKNLLVYGVLFKVRDNVVLRKIPCFNPVLRIQIRIHMFLGLLDPFPSLSKNSKKNLDFYCFVTFFDFLSLKNNVKVHSKSNMQKNFFLNLFFVGISKVNDESGPISQRHRNLQHQFSVPYPWSFYSDPNYHWITDPDTALFFRGFNMSTKK
jgi:hypothetical protein